MAGKLKLGSLCVELVSGQEISQRSKEETSTILNQNPYTHTHSTTLSRDPVNHPCTGGGDNGVGKNDPGGGEIACLIGQGVKITACPF